MNQRRGDPRITLERARERAVAMAHRNPTAAETDGRMRQATVDTDGKPVTARDPKGEHARQLKETPTLAHALRKLSDPSRPPLEPNEEQVLLKHVEGILSRDPRYHAQLQEADKLRPGEKQELIRKLYEDPKFRAILGERQQLIYGNETDIKTDVKSVQEAHDNAVKRGQEIDQKITLAEGEVKAQQMRVDAYLDQDQAAGRAQKGSKLKELEDLLKTKPTLEAEIAIRKRQKTNLEKELQEAYAKLARSYIPTEKENLTNEINQRQSEIDRLGQEIADRAVKLKRIKDLQAEEMAEKALLEQKKANAKALQQQKTENDAEISRLKQKLDIAKEEYSLEQRMILDAVERSLGESVQEYLAYRENQTINEVEEALNEVEARAARDKNNQREQDLDDLQTRIFATWTEEEKIFGIKQRGRRKINSNAIKKALEIYISHGPDAVIEHLFNGALSEVKLNNIRAEGVKALFRLAAQKGLKFSESDALILAHNPMHRKLFQELAQDPVFANRLQQMGIDPKDPDVGRNAQRKLNEDRRC